MKVLELFSGTHSVGKICEERGWEVVSLDLKNATINCNILDWDYTQYEPGHFEFIWASPPCETFSRCKDCWIGRKSKGKFVTRETILEDIENIGKPILLKTREIINYFNPRYFCIENPRTGKMKNYIIDLPYYDIDYCMYGYPYKKATRFWTNIGGFDAKKCNKKCGSFINGRHIASCGGSHKVYGCNYEGQSLNQRYSIPPNLIRELFEHL